MTLADKRRAKLLVLSLSTTFILLRAYLHLSPNTDLNIGGYNIHHLFSGLLLVTFCGIPLIIFHDNSRLLDIAAIGFGVGLSMALDEWVYLIVTDGSNASYLLPVSFWGGLIMVVLACGYVFVLVKVNRKRHIE